MGFGYLLIGYLVTFVLYLTANALQVGFLALWLGYALMIHGVRMLKKYCNSFLWTEGMLWALLLPTVYRTLGALSDLFLWELPWMTATLGTAVSWVEFLLLIGFHGALLMSVGELAGAVGLTGTVRAARRDMIAVSLYAIVYLFVNLPITALDGIRPYFTLSLTVLNLLFILLSLFLLLSCNKNICRDGEEEPPPKRYRWDLLNRIGDGYAKTQEQAAERNRETAEAFLKRRKERKENRKKK